jgi:uncharacterized repeat protein (TIGR01451 family)
MAAAAALLVALVWLTFAGAAQAAVQITLEQCRNGSVDAPEVCTGSAWQNGNLNASQAHYREDDSVPFRSVITGLSLGAHVLEIGYDSTKGGVHAYDYLTSFDRTEGDAAPCSDSAGCSGAPTSTKAIPTDPTLADAAPPVDQVAGSLSAWGATIDGLSYSVLPASPEGTANHVTLKVSFTATSTTVVLAWGGHVASQIDWGAGDGAGAISGSPYHMNIDSLDGPIGSRDRSMQAAVILPAATIGTTASSTSVTVGTPVTDGATLSGAGGTVTGSVAFFVCGPGAATPSCASGGTSLGSVPLAGGAATSPTFTPSAAGRYCFRARYTPAATAPYSPIEHTNTTTECFTAVAEPDVGIVKTAEDPILSAGEGAAFGIVVANVGTGTATGVTVSDTLPAGVNWGLSPAVRGCSIANGVLDCALGGIASGDSVTIRVAGATTAAACGTLTNTATVGAGNEAAGKDADNSSTATLRVDCPDLTVRKEAVASTISAGEDASYTITVTNGGAGAASGVTIADDLPAGVAWSVAPPVQGCAIANGRLECAFPTLAPGASASVTVTGITDAPDCGLLTNTATVAAGNEPAAAAADNSATASIAVNCAPIRLTKTADAPTVSAGDPIGFTITATNPGPGTATGVSVQDALPSTPGTQWSIDGGANQGQCSISGTTLVCDFGLLIQGSSASVHISSPTTEASCSTVDNVAQLTTTNVGNAQAADQVAVECSGLAVDKVADAAAVAAGQPIGFTMTVRNTGTGLARGAALTDPLPAGAGLAWSVSPAVQGCSIAAGTLDCAFGDIPGGQSRTVHVTSPTTADSCAAYANTATGTSGSASLTGQAQTTVVCAPKPGAITEPVREVLGETETPGTPAQPQGEQGGTGGPAAQGRGRLVVVKTAPRRARSGGTITYVIKVTNRGRARALDVVIRDRMPAGLVITRRPSGVTLRSGELTWRVGAVRAGRSRTVRVKVRIARDTVGRRCNVARASADNAALARDRACTVIVRRAVAGVVRPPVTG